MQSFIQRHRIVFIHLAFWLVYFSFFFYQITMKWHDVEPDYMRALLDATLQVSCISCIAYLNYFVFLPRFLKHKNPIRYFLEFIVPYSIVVYILIKGKQYIVDGFKYKLCFLYTTNFAVNMAFIVLFIVIFVAMLKFAENWFELEARNKEIENERLTSELRFLKAQINPHFLFNTLNNLYYLAFTNSPNTTEVIAKLSQMMRYMLYDSNHSRVPMSKEIEYMENYISLEKLRLNDDIPITFTVEGDIHQATIVPLILITFLENAFKHGVSNNAPQAFVHIALVLKDNSCCYRVENSKLPKNTNNEEKSGIGLQNVKRRLELSYPDKYEMKVEDLEDVYRIEVLIQLR